MEAKAGTRKIVKSGESLHINLPIEFIRKAGLEKGDTVAIAYDSLLLIINPNCRVGEEEGN